ncbi:MAG: polyprenol monophosphomannose synthase [Planctomycetota bacterium]
MALNDVCSSDAWPLGSVLVQSATYNECENIRDLIERVLAIAPDLQMLIIDDNSPDGTGQIALSEAAKNPRLHVLVRHGRRGLGSAILEGFLLARKRGFQIAINMDADFSHDPTDIPRLLAAMNPSGGRPADVAIGSRRVPGGSVIGWPLSRHLASWLVCWFTRWVLCVPVHDASSGFRAVRVSVFDRIGGPFSQGYAFQEDLLWRIHREGGRLVEVPVTFIDRTLGTSKADFAESKRSISELLRLASQTWLSKKYSRLPE